MPGSRSQSERCEAAQRGLYRPEFEKDSCGVGFVANQSGIATHQVLQQALTVLANLEHRGAAASDPLTGDGAGVLLQIPHALFAHVCIELGIKLGAKGSYGVGMLFLPADARQREQLLALLTSIIEAEGQELLGVREVPTHIEIAGPSAKESAPYIVQCFVGPGTLAIDENALSRKLYVIRKRFESLARREHLTDGDYPYAASFSTKTIVYKGLLTPEQLPHFYPDLANPLTVTALAIVHQRFSTNTFPSWSRAHPYRRIAHNGEINTLRGNVNWMSAREPVLHGQVFGEDVQKLLPIIDTRGSDSAMFDDVLELLVHTGRSLPHAMMMMIPEAWQQHSEMEDERRAFYEYHACIMEPWDGPACIAFSDGRYVGAVLDRNGLRPARYVVTKNGLVVMASEAGVLDIPADEIVKKDRLTPGRMFLVDTLSGTIVEDETLKRTVAERRPYGRWIDAQLVRLGDLPFPSDSVAPPLSDAVRQELQRAFGYSEEDLTLILPPMAATGEEPLGSMGNDTPIAALSHAPQLLYAYFRQAFAQVTNPAIDPIREALVMSLVTYLGPEANLFEESPDHARKLQIDSPILSAEDMERIRALSSNTPKFGRTSIANKNADVEIYKHAATVDTTFDIEHDLEHGLRQLTERAVLAAESGATLLVLSDKGTCSTRAPIPALLAVGAVHHHLIRKGLRSRIGLIVESGEPREVMHFALLAGFGAGGVHPYLAEQSVRALVRQGLVEGVANEKTAVANFRKALEKGMLKVMSKMGISTLQSYRGAQIFEVVGLDHELVDRFFSGTPNSLSGATLADVESAIRRRHDAAWPTPVSVRTPDDTQLPDAALLPVGGLYRFRRRGERHAWNPQSIALLQHAVRANDARLFRNYLDAVDGQTTDLAQQGALLVRGLLSIQSDESRAIDLSEVEPAHSIVSRFKTGAMSFGSISKEAHETLAIAMNRLGAKSNTGEGGEDPSRYIEQANGDSKRSAIKQVASARFGVTMQYLVEADELQIKIAQGAKPGEGGQLPGHKVDAHIAATRHATVGIGLISPPPHHDIYSIEDLAQLIFDLRNANRHARISVKLVSEAGVGTVAAGVAKAKADVILISGDSGGTGASPLTSLKHTGTPWELGLSEAHQTLTLNGLRHRVRLEVDGQLKSARDIVMAAMLGADEFGFGTAALVSMGCIMVRACHLNTCPVGIATQDPRLRARFAGQPEHVINFFSMLAEEVRIWMARLGARRFDELVGRTDWLEANDSHAGSVGASIDVSRLLFRPSTLPSLGTVSPTEDQELELALDTVLIEQARPALEYEEQVEIELPIRNIHRTTCTMLSAEVTRRYGARGLADSTIRIRFDGTAGQSFAAFLAPGIDVVLSGDANDGLGKGLSGGRVVVFPPENASYAADDNVIVGNAALYGATSGEVFLRGKAGERFAVRNSGATAVLEGLGDHGCEYMTGGVVIVLGAVGRNFAAGMSGGVAYLLDAHGNAGARINPAMVELKSLSSEDLRLVRTLVHRHHQRTMSSNAWRILSGWKQWSARFVKVVPKAAAAPIVESAHTSLERGAAR